MSTPRTQPEQLPHPAFSSATRETHRFAQWMAVLSEFVRDDVTERAFDLLDQLYRDGATVGSAVLALRGYEWGAPVDP